MRVKARKSLLSKEERASAAARVFELIEQTAAFMLSDHILMYHSLPDELSTREFIDRWNTRKHFYLPRVNGVNLDILPYDRTRLHLGAFNIEEPDGDETADINAIELIIVPSGIRQAWQPHRSRQRILRPSAARHPRHYYGRSIRLPDMRRYRA